MSYLSSYASYKTSYMSSYMSSIYRYLCEQWPVVLGHFSPNLSNSSPANCFFSAQKPVDSANWADCHTAKEAEDTGAEAEGAGAEADRSAEAAPPAPPLVPVVFYVIIGEVLHRWALLHKANNQDSTNN